MIQPTVGRVLWFHPELAHPEAQPHAAIIAHVLHDSLVNLACFDMNGMAYSVRGAMLWQGDGEPPEAPYAEWMPYQIGQAAKAEAEATPIPQPIT